MTVIRPRRVALPATHRMPPWSYVTLHPDARLSEAEVAQLQTWSRGAAAEPPVAERPGRPEPRRQSA